MAARRRRGRRPRPIGDDRRLGNAAERRRRPAAAGRHAAVLMIGDVIGKPGRVAARARCCPSCARTRGIDFVTANGENLAGGMGLTPSTARGALRRRRRRHHDAATTSGTSARSTRARPRRAHPAAAQLRHARACPGRGWGIYHALDGTEVAVINAPGPHVHAADREPVHRRSTGCSTRPPTRCRPSASSTSTASSRREKNALRAATSTGGSAPSSAPTRTSPTGDERILPAARPTRPTSGMTGPDLTASSASRPRPSCRASSTRLPTRFEVGDGPGRLQRAPDRHRPGDRPGARDRADPAPRRRRREPLATRQLTGSRSCRRRHRRSTSTPTRPAPTASSSPPSSCAAMRDAGVRAARDHRPRHARGLPRARAAGSAARRQPGLDAHPGRRDQHASSTPRRIGLGGEGELHILGFGVDPDDEAFEAALAAQRGQRRRAVRADARPAARARAAGRRADRSARPRRRSTRSAGPTSRGRSWRAGPRDERRGRVRALPRPRRPAYVPRDGHRARARRSRRSAPPAASPVLAHFREAAERAGRRRASSSSWGLGGLEVYYRGFDAGDRRALVATVARRSGLLATGGSDYHGDRDRLRRRRTPSAARARRAWAERCLARRSRPLRGRASTMQPRRACRCSTSRRRRPRGARRPRAERARDERSRSSRPTTRSCRASTSGRSAAR